MCREKTRAIYIRNLRIRTHVSGTWRFSWKDGNLHKRAKKTTSGCYRMCGRHVFARRAIRFRVRIGSFGADIVYPGKLTADRAGEREREREGRAVCRRHLRERRVTRSIDRVALRLFRGAAYRRGTIEL